MRRLLPLCLLLLAGVGTGRAQGYVNFSATKNTVWDDFTGVNPVVSSGTAELTFMWTASSTVAAAWPYGSTATNSASSSVGFGTIESYLAAGWSLATNQVTGGEADVTTGVGGIAVGSFSYNGGSTFQLKNSSSGTIYTVVLAWDNRAGTTFAQAINSVYSAQGVSGLITYDVKATSSSPAATFTGSGLVPFSVVKAPEPGIGAATGLGATLLALRRRPGRR